MNNICSVCGKDMMAGPCCHMRNLSFGETCILPWIIKTPESKPPHKWDGKDILEILNDLDKRIESLEK